MLVSTSRWLAEIWKLSRRGATGQLEVEFKFQRRSCKLSFLFQENAPKNLLAGLYNSLLFSQFLLQQEEDKSRLCPQDEYLALKS